MDFKILNELRIKKKFEILNVSLARYVRDVPSYLLYVFKYFDSLSNLIIKKIQIYFH